MLILTIKILFISILFIFLVHHLICFFKNTLTIPKTKDLVTSSSKKYENMLSIIANTNTNTNTSLSKQITDYTEIDLLPSSESEMTSMKDELKSFIKKQWNGSYDDTSSGFMPFDS